MFPETTIVLWLLVISSMTSVTFIFVVVVIFDLSRAVCPTPLPCFCLGDDVIDCAMMWFEDLPYFLDFGGVVWKELNLSENVLTYFPAKGFWGVKVRILKMNRNMISSMDVETFKGSDGVVELDLNGNRIESFISGTFAWLPLLKTLKLQFNRFKNLHEDTFVGADNLEILDLQGNDLTAVPNSALRKLPNLRQLSLRNNRIKDLLPLSFSHLSKSLQLIDLGDNAAPVTVHKDAFCGLEPRQHSGKGQETSWSGLNVLLLDHNGIRKFDLCFVRGVWTLKILDVSGNPLLCDCSTIYLSNVYSSSSSSSSSSSLSSFWSLTSSVSMVPPHVASSILLSSPSFTRTIAASRSTFFPGAQCESPYQFAGQYLSNFSETLYRRFCPNHPPFPRQQQRNHQQQQNYNSGFQLHTQQKDERDDPENRRNDKNKMNNNNNINDDDDDDDNEDDKHDLRPLGEGESPDLSDQIREKHDDDDDDANSENDINRVNGILKHVTNNNNNNNNINNYNYNNYNNNNNNNKDNKLSIDDNYNNFVLNKTNLCVLSTKCSTFRTDPSKASRLNFDFIFISYVQIFVIVIVVVEFSLEMLQDLNSNFENDDDLRHRRLHLNYV